jgi:uracil-DNA glycosylase family 4
MSQPAEEPSPDFRRQLQAYLESLRAAGVEWLPLGGLAVPPSPPPVLTADNVAPGKTLFEEPLEEAVAKGPAVPPAEVRRQALTLLAETVVGCTRCAELARRRTQTVFGVGAIDPPICFVGEAPGASEDARGEPFVGDAGQLLNRIIIACGLKREEVYICNIIKCRPPDNRLPLADEAGNCREYLERQLELVRPKFLCALGACAAQNLLNSKLPIGKLRGRFHDYRGIPVLCTYHPAYLLRSPERKKDVWEDMKKLLARMGRPVPPK